MRRCAIRCALAAIGVLALSACGSGGSSGNPTAVSITSVAPSTGTFLGGTAVVINGANFQYGATVKFGTQPATFVGFNSPMSLSASTPAAQPGSVTVTVTNPGGQSGALPNGFTYINPGCTIPATVTADMTLDAGCVWSVPQTVVVGGPNGAVLTVPAGTTVTFATSPPAALVVGTQEPGSLVAQGTSAAGIMFTSAATSPAAGDWGGIVLGPQSTSTIAFATIDYAGGPGANGISDTAALTVEGGDVAGGSGSPAPVLQNLSIQNSAGHGLLFAGLDTGFGQGSADITVNNWEPSTHYPYVLEANQGATIPQSITATPAGGSAVIAFNSYVNSGSPGSCYIETTQTWPPFPLPILAVAYLEVGSPNYGNMSATLTIAAPNTLEFMPGTEMDIDPAAYGTGFLRANGNNGDTGSLVFTSTDGGPWGGLYFAVGAQTAGQSASSLSYATINFASGPPNGPPAYGTGAISVSNATGISYAVAGPTIANCRIENYPSYGITLVDIDSSNYNSYANNTFGIPSMVGLPDGGTAGSISSFCSEAGEGNCTNAL